MLLSHWHKARRYRSGTRGRQGGKANDRDAERQSRRIAETLFCEKQRSVRGFATMSAKRVGNGLSEMNLLIEQSRVIGTEYKVGQFRQRRAKGRFL